MANPEVNEWKGAIPSEIDNQSQQKVGKVADKVSALIGATDTAVESSNTMETENFRIDSSNWKITRLEDDGTRVKINPEGDVTELLEGPFVGEQHFTLEAAEREITKMGKRLWNLPKQWVCNAEEMKSLGVKLSGIYTLNSKGIKGVGQFGSYWLISPDREIGSAKSVVFGPDGGEVRFTNGRTKKMSVRCMKD